jgi:hypothetical protein
MFRFYAIPIPTQVRYCEDIDELLPKCVCRGKSPRVAKTKFKIKVGRLSLSKFRTYYKASLIRTV